MTILSAVAGAILVAFGLFLVGLTVVVFAKPAVAERFFMAFASSARTHYTEQIVRLLIGASLILRSGAMWQPRVFWVIGWAIVLSSLMLILTPWQWHDRFGEQVRPRLIRYMKLFAVGLLAFGVLLLYGVGLGESRYLQR
jgi:cell division protein FtsW (lipid II flippase)